MHKLFVGAFGFVLLCSVGCDKKDDAAKPASSGTTTAASAAPAAKSATPTGAAPAAANDPVVCCKFGGVKGSSTKKLCEDGKGTVMPDSDCPTLKK